LRSGPIADMRKALIASPSALKKVPTAAVQRWPDLYDSPMRRTTCVFVGAEGNKLPPPGYLDWFSGPWCVHTPLSRALAALNGPVWDTAVVVREDGCCTGWRLRTFFNDGGTGGGTPLQNPLISQR
jgi:hypothetical protein